jgi:ABC-type bacteriocin/lantibiotic exporter with double-glycine peptidase domain
LVGIDRPIVLHFEKTGSSSTPGGHFAVLAKCNAESATIVDGSTGIISAISRKKLVDLWSGYTLILEYPKSYARKVLTTCGVLSAAVGYAVAQLIQKKLVARKTNEHLIRQLGDDQ